MNVLFIVGARPITGQMGTNIFVVCSITLVVLAASSVLAGCSRHGASRPHGKAVVEIELSTIYLHS